MLMTNLFTNSKRAALLLLTVAVAVTSMPGSSTQPRADDDMVVARERVQADLPAAPANLTLEIVPEGVQVSWDAVRETASGAEIDSEAVVYSVQRSDRRYIATKTHDTSVTDTTVIPEEGQTEVSYTVYAYADESATRSSESVSQTIIAGNPYNGSFSESFAGGSASTSAWSFGPEGASTSAWNPSTGSYSNPYCTTAGDSDGGFLLFDPSSSYRDGHDYMSPLIVMDGASNPQLSFSIFKYTAAPEEPLVRLYIVTENGKEALEGGELVFHANNDGWVGMSLTLPQTAGAFRILFEGERVAISSYSAYKAIIDQIEIRDVLAKDAVLSSAVIPAEILPGKRVDIPFSVSNNGSETLNGVTVSLTVYGTEVWTSEPFSIEPGADFDMSAPFYATPFLTGTSVTAVISVNADGEMNADDNLLMGEISVGCHDLPLPLNLTAERIETGARISWDTPVLPDIAPAVEFQESFEDWDSGETTPRDGWIFVDTDGKEKAGLAGINSGGQYAFFVTDKLSTSAMFTLEMADGEKCLVTTRAYDYSDTEVWLVSPTFDPTEPVSFAATGVETRYETSATFELGYLPAGSADIADFVKTDDIETSGYGWDEISLTFPAEAARFVVHAKNLDINAYAFDNFRFHKIDEIPELTGFNLWRDGKCVTELGSDIMSYDDTEAVPLECYRYHLSAVYSPEREVMDPEGVELLASGGSGIDNVSAGYYLHVSGRAVSADGPFEVFAADGTKVAERVSGGSIELTPGIY